MRHLMLQTERVAQADANIFLFTTFDQLKRNVLVEPVWHRASSPEPMPLFTREQGFAL
jgi:hypothetical protein